MHYKLIFIITVILFIPEILKAFDDPRSIEVAFRESRTALVIGNSDYQNGPLRNPVNDASDIAKLLEQRNFNVILLTNANKSKIELAIHRFGEKLSRGGIGLFYYAGHAMQVNGINYLLPVDTFLRKESDAKYKAVDVGLVLTELDDSQNRLNLVILDSCRDNPFARSFRSVNKGLARMDAPRGTLIAYATSPGKTAIDGDGRNGTYTKHLLEQMSVPGQEMQTMFKRIRASVERETDGAQTSEEWNRVTGDFYFTPIDFLDQDLDLTAEELARYKQILAEQKAAENRIKKMEVDKKNAIAKMEEEIEELRRKINHPDSSSNTLDELIALGKQREQYKKDIVEAKAKAEYERQQRESKIAKLRARELEKRKKKFEAEYNKYKLIANSEFLKPKEIKRAWKLICKKWKVKVESDEPGILFWDDKTGSIKAMPISSMLLSGDWKNLEGNILSIQIAIGEPILVKYSFGFAVKDVSLNGTTLTFTTVYLPNNVEKYWKLTMIDSNTLMGPCTNNRGWSGKETLTKVRVEDTL